MSQTTNQGNISTELDYPGPRSQAEVPNGVAQKELLKILFGAYPLVSWENSQFRCNFQENSEFRCNFLGQLTISMFIFQLANC